MKLPLVKLASAQDTAEPVTYPVTYSETLGLADAISVQVVHCLRDGLRFGASTDTLAEVLVTVREDLGFRDVVHHVWALIFSEALGLGDDPAATSEYLAQLVDAIALHAGEANLLDAQDVVVEAIALGDAHAFVWPAAIAEHLGLTDASSTLLEAWNRIIDGVRLAATPTHSATLTAIVTEEMALAASTTTAAELFALVREGLALMVTVALDDGVYMGWVFHAGPNAYTSYSNVNFNSFCQMPDGRYYGAMPDGLYLLEGDDDAGTDIAAHVRAGLENFGTQRMKRMPMMYVGYRTNGDVLLKVVTTSPEGDKREDIYKLEQRTADAMRESRVKIGRGLKSVYWGFELANVDGADFEIDSVEFFPMVLDRRVN
jgi:hypothetical protein